MRESSNPVFRSLPKGQGGYAQFGTGAAGYGAQAVQADPYVTQYPDQRQTGVARPLTIDDVVTKTAVTLGVLTAVASVTYFLVVAEPWLGHAARAWSARSAVSVMVLDRDVRTQAGQPGDRADLRRARGSVPRRGLVLRSRIVVSDRWPRDDRAGDLRHRRCVRRHARRLQDRRHPGDAEVHPIHGRRHVRRRGYRASSTLVLAIFTARRRGLRSS